jgi:hypothetical protein
MMRIRGFFCVEFSFLGGWKDCLHSISLLLLVFVLFGLGLGG